MDLTIIIPSYNCAKYISCTLDSIIKQTIQPKKILIIDDATTDNSNEIIEHYQRKYKHIQLIHNKTNKGVIYTVNRGFRICKTKYVMSLAADDWILPGFIEKSMLLLNKYPQAGLSSTGSLVAIENQNNKLKIASMPRPLKIAGYLSPQKASAELIRLDSWFMGNSVIMNRNILLELGGYREELKSFTDNFLYRLIAIKYGCCFIPEPLSVWRIRPKSFSQSHCNNILQISSILDSYQQLITNDFKNLFSEKMINVELKRWQFKISKTLAENIHAKPIFYALWYGAISCILFVYFRPFDVWPFLVRKITPGIR